MTRRRGRKPKRTANDQSGESLTADILARAVYDDLIPEHRKTCEDYGFDRAISVEEKSNLLGLYQGLIKFMEISPKTIHDWRVRGVLVDEIKAAYNKIPKGSRGGYFPWFLQNQHIIALAGRPLTEKDMQDHDDRMLVRTWRFTGGSEKDSPKAIRAAIERKPIEEQQCYALYTLTLCRWSPPPSIDLWIDFGFASCASEAEENVLGGQYHWLIKICTFSEFCDAYRHRRLINLFHSKGLQINGNAPLRDLLSSHLPLGCRKSVWDLKALVLQEVSASIELTIIPSVTVDYGFINCNNASERRQLMKVYKDFFSHREDPLALHEAAIKGNLYHFLSNRVQGVQGPKFQRLLKNLYPLPELDLPVDGSWEAQGSTSSKSGDAVAVDSSLADGASHAGNFGPVFSCQSTSSPPLVGQFTPQNTKSDGTVVVDSPFAGGVPEAENSDLRRPTPSPPLVGTFMPQNTMEDLPVVLVTQPLGFVGWLCWVVLEMFGMH